MGSLRIVSTSRASDGSFTAISELGAVLRGHPYQLIGGLAVVLHQYRLGLAHPIRATADADFGVPPYALSDASLVAAVGRLGYEQIAGNQWRRPLAEGREATVDLLVPSYRTRLRSSVRHGRTNTTEVGGLAVALRGSTPSPTRPRVPSARTSARVGSAPPSRSVMASSVTVSPGSRARPDGGAPGAAVDSLSAPEGRQVTGCK